MEANIICWDGSKYRRYTTEEEVEEMKKRGYYKVGKDGDITFDFGNGMFGEYDTKSGFIG